MTKDNIVPTMRIDFDSEDLDIPNPLKNSVESKLKKINMKKATLKSAMKE